MVINAMKVFDIVFVMGNAETNQTEVIAERMIRWFFISNHDGRGAAIAVVLFIAVIPVMVWNVRASASRRRSDERGRLTSSTRSVTDRPVEPAKGCGIRNAAAGSCASRLGRRPVADPDDRRARHVVPPEALADTTGWWTVLAHPFEPASGRSRTTEHALDAGGFQNAFLNSLAVTIPATVIPITIAAFAAYAFSWMEFRGRYVMFVLVVGLMVVPLQMALIPILRLYTGGASLGGAGHPRPRAQRHVPRRLARPHRLRAPPRRLPASQLHRVAAVVDHRVGEDRRRRPLHDLLAPRRPAVGAGAAAFAIFQFLWVWNDLLVAYVFLGGTQENRVSRSRLQTSSGPAERTGTCSPRRPSSRWRSR